MSMFCFQCQEAAQGVGCTVMGVCGKDPAVSGLQDLLIYATKGIANIVVKGDIDPMQIPEINHAVLNSLFLTITNANFDEESIEREVKKMLALRDDLKRGLIDTSALHDAALFEVTDRGDILGKASAVGILATKNEDIRSLRELITYGLKGMASYAHHALNLGKENHGIYAFIYKALNATLDDNLALNDLVSLTLETGQYGVDVMALLDDANTSRYGHPEMTQVNIDVRSNPAILVSGHDLTDLEQLLEQTKNSGVDVYTHSEMLPAHYYPAFKKYDHFVGNYGNA